MNNIKKLLFFSFLLANFLTKASVPVTKIYVDNKTRYRLAADTNHLSGRFNPRIIATGKAKGKGWVEGNEIIKAYNKQIIAKWPRWYWDSKILGTLKYKEILGKGKFDALNALFETTIELSNQAKTVAPSSLANFKIVIESIFNSDEYPNIPIPVNEAAKLGGGAWSSYITKIKLLNGNKVIEETVMTDKTDKAALWDLSHHGIPLTIDIRRKKETFKLLKFESLFIKINESLRSKM